MHDKIYTQEEAKLLSNALESIENDVFDMQNFSKRQSA